MTSDQSPEIIALLKELVTEIKDIKELISLTTDDGTPIKNIVPTQEFIAATACAAAMLAKERPGMTEQDIFWRIHHAMELACVVTRDFDAWLQHTRAGRLEQRFHNPS